MFIKFNFGIYLVCMFIAFTFVPMMSAFCQEREVNKKAAGFSAIVLQGYMQ